MLKLWQQYMSYWYYYEHMKGGLVSNFFYYKQV